MKVLMLAASAALLTGITPAQGAVVTMGSSYAEACYRAADARVFHQRAVNECNQALANEALMRDDRVGTLVNRGILRMLAGNLQDANRDFDAAIALDSGEPEAWLNKAIASMNGGNSKAALPMIDKAIELKTTKPQVAYFVRGLAHEDLGNLNAAYADLRRAQSLAPKWRDPGVELARYQVKAR